jgi:XRE family aerobic/anaerobic benzoate catabolism transcriptional regulator
MSDNAVSKDLEAFNQQIADRIRGLRAQRGMTRRALAESSEVSERYLAQIETAKANISIGILLQLSHALGVELGQLMPSRNPLQTDLNSDDLRQLVQAISTEQRQLLMSLLVESPSVDANNHKGLALIGLRGAGKTTLGSMAAEHLHMDFVRQSDIIESDSGMQVGELFALGGQQAYRRREYQAIERIIEAEKPIIFEAGGSLVSQQATFELLRQNFYVVWVQTSPDEHMDRVIAQEDLRPITIRKESMIDLKLILQERTPMYQQANYFLNTSQRDVQECVDELIQVYQHFIHS